MKYKHMKERLTKRQTWWDNQDDRYKSAHKRPGSVKSR